MRKQKISENKAAGRAIGVVLACQFAEMVAKRIIEMGHTINSKTVAQVAAPLGLHPIFVDEAEYKALSSLVPKPASRRARK